MQVYKLTVSGCSPYSMLLSYALITIEAGQPRIRSSTVLIGTEARNLCSRRNWWFFFPFSQLSTINKRKKKKQKERKSIIYIIISFYYSILLITASLMDYSGLRVTVRLSVVEVCFSENNKVSTLKEF